MKKSKVYLVVKDLKAYYFYTWVECQSFIKHQSNIFYKSFQTDKIAQNFYSQLLNKVNTSSYLTHVYTDGSYDAKTNQSSFGWVAIKEETVIAENSGIVPYKNESRNIDGEIYAILSITQWIDEVNISGIELYYDYLGIEFWAYGLWKAKTQLPKKYSEVIIKYLPKIHFLKVKSHSNNLWNDHVDNLAKKALNL